MKRTLSVERDIILLSPLTLRQEVKGKKKKPPPKANNAPLWETWIVSMSLVQEGHTQLWHHYGKHSTVCPVVPPVALYYFIPKRIVGFSRGDRWSHFLLLFLLTTTLLIIIMYYEWKARRVAALPSSPPPWSWSNGRLDGHARLKTCRRVMRTAITFAYAFRKATCFALSEGY